MQINNSRSLNNDDTRSENERRLDGGLNAVSGAGSSKSTLNNQARIRGNAQVLASDSSSKHHHHQQQQQQHFHERINNKSSYRSKEDTIEYIDEDLDEDDEEDNEEEDKRDRWRPPDVWSDDVRMNALFAPFRSRNLNPLHYDNKLKFWKDLIIDYCKQNDIVEIDSHTAAHWFIRKGIKPKCLDLVVSELSKEKKLVARDEALKPVAASGIIHNVFNKLIWTPLSWSTSYLFRSASQSSDQTLDSSQLSTTKSPASSPTRLLDTSSLHNSASSPSTSFSSPVSSPTYVLIDLLVSKSERLLKLLQDRVIHSNVDCVLTYEEVCNLVDSKEIPSDQIDLVVRYLEAQKRIYIDETSIPGRRLVKFTLNSNRHVAPEITEIELSFLKLKDEEKKLNAEVNRLNAEIENMNTSIKIYLKQGNKTAALKLLKRRKQMEKSTESKEGILANVQTLIMNIEQADTNKLTYDIFSKGVLALREAHKGMNADQIDETMDDLQDIIAANAEIEETLAKPTVLPAKFNFDDSELNAELNELIAAEENNEATDSFEMDELLKNLPNVVNSTIMSTTNEPVKKTTASQSS